MKESINIISFDNLAFAFIPVFIVVGILYKWGQDYRNALYAMLRMLVQLLLIGYILSYIFGADNAWVVLMVLTVMILTSSWISLRTVKEKRMSLYGKALFSITLGGGVTFILIIFAVLDPDPWYLPNYCIPIAGMIFANGMNSVSLAADRLSAEIDRSANYEEARNIAFRSSLIPITNSLFAVGLVSLPGMMTGQILSGVSPLIAVRYQIMVMCMVFGAAGISSACFLMLVKRDFLVQK